MTVRAGLCSLAMCLAAQPAFSQTIAYNSYRPGDAYDAGNTRTQFTGSGSFAVPFTPAASGAIQWIDAGLAMSGPQPVATMLTFTVHADANGLPGASRGSFSFVAVATPDPFNMGTPPGVPRYAPASVGGIELTAGQNYWLALGISNATFSNSPTWWVSDLSQVSRPALFNGGVWSLRPQAPQPAFRVVVPAPSGLAMLLGACALAARRRRD